MAKGILMLITVSDKGHISVDIRGPVQGKDGILTILNEARKLVEQGTYSAKL
jgi:hypothetical protein